MRIVVTYSVLTERFVVELGSFSGDASTVTEASDGATLWWNSRGEVEMATLSVASEVTGRALLGDSWDDLKKLAVGDGPSERTVELDRADVPTTRALTMRQGSGLDESDVRLEHLIGDGVPREIPVGTIDGDVRGALVDLPDVSGARDLLDDRTARVAWSPTTAEFKIQFEVKPGRRTRLWVRVARGESGDLIAMAPPISDDAGRATATTIVPHDGYLGELYVDVTDEPMSVIGSSRFRARRRAASLESRAARLREAGQTSEAARFSSEAARLRTELGDTASAANAGSPIDRRRPWFISVVLLLIAGAFMLGRADGSDSDEIDTGFTTIPESEPVGSSTPDRVSVDSSEVLAYAGDSTIFSGDTNVSIAARILAPIEGAAARLEFQVNDRAEFAYRDGMAPITDQLESECRGGLYSNTGSGGGGYSVPIDVVILGANGRDRAVELLTSPTWTDQEVLGSFSGDVALIANYTEDCVRRTTPSGDKLFLAYRQVYEIKRIDITPSEPMTHVVVRGVLADGSPTTWTSTDVMPLVSGG
jgi:hypothetical protein